MATTSTANKNPRMPYRFLGNSGLLVSKLSLGSWMDFDDQFTPDAWFAMMKMAFEHGINLFDNAEIYGRGQAERNMGTAIKEGVHEGVWSREDLVITTKIFYGSLGFPEGPFGKGPASGLPSNAQGLSRKHIVEGTKASLERLQLEYVDVIFCHRADAFTPIEETVRAMNFVIQQGWAFYWGTSSWSAAQIVEACEIADRLGLARPIVEQPEYNLIERNMVEFEYVDLYKKYKLGLTTWSPLGFGTLTGKYSSGGASDGARLRTPEWSAVVPDFAERVAKAEKLKPIAEALGIPMALLAIAWCVCNDNVTTVLLGAKTPAQLAQNLQALDVLPKLTRDVKDKIEAALPFVPHAQEKDWASHMRQRHL
ncbi:Voltage-gated potassium channel subunit beta-2 [Phytophthora pseudosyringae]|uniref:Voltage-gated potassium channel subunit beta-2 n=1 Tax=Phytophthora pseudosyringae TaxID=221518 RepID=A0A8T1V5S2_9STRA|nr:Voltage-gated potassium channel subunit beta-2 [Phytophthora pseudosyringae]